MNQTTRDILIGSSIAFAGTIFGIWIQSYFTAKQSVIIEKRQKLELLMESAVKLNYCVYSAITNPHIRSECTKEGYAFRVQTLTNLYFHEELRDEATLYVNGMLSIDKQIRECEPTVVTAETLQNKINCLNKLSNDANGYKEFNNLNNKAASISKTLQ